MSYRSSVNDQATLDAFDSLRPHQKEAIEAAVLGGSNIALAAKSRQKVMSLTFELSYGTGELVCL